MHIETPIPTPAGWCAIADLRPGDYVFDAAGKRVRVSGISGVMYDHTCYEVCFSDGSTIVADADHEWLTWTHAARKAHGRSDSPTIGPSVVTTERIKGTLTHRDRGDLNHSVYVAEPIECAYADLPIDPYAFGVWLGDGASKAAEITCHEDEYEIIEQLAQLGLNPKRRAKADSKTAQYAIGGKKSIHDPVNGRLVSNGSLLSSLKALGVIKNKHIPMTYLRASEEQRLALLQGLMDTDGTITATGHCEFTTISQQLADGVMELCSSLGLKATVKVGRAKLNGRDCGPKYRICFTPYIPVFRLKRKACRVKKAGKQAKRQSMRYIVDVKPHESVPVCCIEIEGESHLYLAGKTFIPTHNSRCGAEFVIERARLGMGPIALVGQTKSDVRDTMVELGPASIIKVSPPWFMPTYEVSKRRLVWPNGVTATIYSGDEPNQLRGPQHATAWVDEVAKFQFPVETMDNLELGLRVGTQPQMVITTTPRPIPVIRNMIADPDFVVTYGSSYDNLSNLSGRFIERILSKYEGSRLGRQELHGVVLDDVEGALWTHELIDKGRVKDIPPLKRVVVSVDPKVSEKADSECGIVVSGLGYDDHVYILADKSVNASHTVWSQAIVNAFWDFEGDMIYGEVNNGGDLVEAVIRSVDNRIPFEAVRASRGKQTRAEPVANLYDQGRVHHMGVLPELEDQMCVWTPGEDSPDRMDALVWGVWGLVIKDQEEEKIAKAKSR